MTMENNTIELKGVTVNYGKPSAPFTAVRDVNLTVPQGTVCALIGPSGCGKSTLLKVMAGLMKPASGTVNIGGRDVNPHDLTIGLMPQNYGLLPWKNVRDNILLGCRVRHQDMHERQPMYVKLLEQLGLKDLLFRYPRELSGGQQQRVALARAFLLQPDILLMDEPFSALDALTREAMQDVFLGLWREHRVTTVLVTHYVEEALYLGHQIALMQSAPGRIAEIIDNPWGCQGLDRGRDDVFRLSRTVREKLRKLEVGDA